MIEQTTGTVSNFRAETPVIEELRVGVVKPDDLLRSAIKGYSDWDLCEKIYIPCLSNCC